MTTKFLPEIIYSLALTSLSTHMLWLRKDSEEQRAHYTARINLLEQTIRHVRAGEPVPQHDYDTLRRLANETGAERAAARGVETTEEITWREVLLGRKGEQSEKYEARDWAEGA